MWPGGEEGGSKLLCQLCEEWNAVCGTDDFLEGFCMISACFKSL